MLNAAHLPCRRFFGKFLGTHGDYYVFEATLHTPPAEPADEAAGTRAGARDS